MPALAERTKIKAETGNVSITTCMNFYSDYAGPCVFLSDSPIDANAYMIASGSIQVQTQQYIPELSSKAKAVLHRLYSFKQLKLNWNGNGALVPEEEVIKAATNFLFLLDEYDLPIYFTAPGPNGEIVLEYKNGQNSAEIFFESDNFSEMLLYNGDVQIYAGKIEKKLLIDHFNQH
jgi:hypothetical protein